MKAICEYTKEEYIAMQDKHRRLVEATSGLSRADMFKDYSKGTGYAHYKFRGVYTKLLVERLGHKPDADEIIMLVDGGFSHFGATCSIDDVTRHFVGRVNTD